MANALEITRRKLSEIKRAFIIVAIVTMILAVLIVWTDFLLKLLVGVFVLLISYSFFYLAYKINTISKILD